MWIKSWLTRNPVIRPNMLSERIKLWRNITRSLICHVQPHQIFLDLRKWHTGLQQEFYKIDKVKFLCTTFLDIFCGSLSKCDTSAAIRNDKLQSEIWLKILSKSMVIVHCFQISFIPILLFSLDLDIWKSQV